MTTPIDPRFSLPLFTTPVVHSGKAQAAHPGHPLHAAADVAAAIMGLHKPAVRAQSGHYPTDHFHGQCHVASIGGHPEASRAVCAVYVREATESFGRVTPQRT